MFFGYTNTKISNKISYSLRIIFFGELIQIINKEKCEIYAIQLVFHLLHSH